MSKRTIPLLYIHQPKEVVTEADNQEYFYHKKLVVNKNDRVKQKVENNKDRETNEHEELKLVIEESGTDDLHGMNEDGETIEEEPMQQSFTDSDITAKLAYIQSIPAVINPKIEITVEEKKYNGVLEKFEEGIVVLRTRTTPYKVEFLVSQVTAVKIISL